MAAIKELAATVRSGTGKGAARSVRREGRIPGVIYGGGEAAEAISLDYTALNRLIYAGHFPHHDLRARRRGQETTRPAARLSARCRQGYAAARRFSARLKETGSFLRVEIPVHFINQDAAPGLKKGGTLNVVRHSVELRVPADNIPEALIADLGGFDINDSLHISAIKMPEGCRPVIATRDFTVATIAPPTTYQEEAPAAAAATAAPAAGANGAGSGSPRTAFRPRGAAAPAKAPAAPAKK